MNTPTAQTPRAPGRSIPVSARVLIVNVRLVEAKARTIIGSVADVEEDTEIQVQHKAHLSQMLDERRFFQIRAGVRLLVADPGQPTRPLVQVAGFFELTYLLPPEFEATEAELEEFARVNGVFNAWPYFREFVQSTMARMGLPPIVLPLYRPGVSPIPKESAGKAPRRKKAGAKS